MPDQEMCYTDEIEFPDDEWLENARKHHPAFVSALLRSLGQDDLKDSDVVHAELGEQLPLDL